MDFHRSGNWKPRVLCARPGPASLPARSGSASTGSWLWFPHVFPIMWNGLKTAVAGPYLGVATAVCALQPAALSLSAAPTPALCGPFALVFWLLSPRLWDSDLTTSILLHRPQITRPEDSDQAKLAAGPVAVGCLDKA